MPECKSLLDIQKDCVVSGLHHSSTNQRLGMVILISLTFIALNLKKNCESYVFIGV